MVMRRKDLLRRKKRGGLSNRPRKKERKGRERILSQRMINTGRKDAIILMLGRKGEVFARVPSLFEGRKKERGKWWSPSTYRELPEGSLAYAYCFIQRKRERKKKEDGSNRFSGSRHGGGGKGGCVRELIFMRRFLSSSFRGEEGVGAFRVREGEKKKKKGEGGEGRAWCQVWRGTFAEVTLMYNLRGKRGRR